ncbi:probable disease resistance protein At5g66900 [Arachis stenosperma]|uniref:probable disease resistance protein At5g66900 n=1 Tax=Arachis stenosperma TaxID=217475 RepID=UPI0025ABDF7D|nr:probable disease resistance protein At5g66900 [Arachis stenosperma]
MVDGSLFSGGAVGAGMQEVLRLAIEMVEKGKNFKSVLKTKKETLDALTPLVEEMKQYARELDRGTDTVASLEKEINKGKEIVEKCSKFRWWRFPSFPLYHDRIEERNKKLGRILSVNVQTQIGRDVMEVLYNVRNILDIIRDDYGGRLGEEKVLRGVSGVPEKPEFTVGLEEPLKKLKVEVLKKDGDRVLLVTGLGGSGKSTLAKKLCWDEQVKGMFADNIFFQTVSKSPNLKNIVQTLFEHCGLRAPEFQTDEEAINRLGNLLRHVGDKGRPILLVLDDVWSGTDSIVEKFKFSTIPDYKIVVTSRFAFRRFHTQFHLKPLGDDDAVSLFHHFTQAKDTNSYKPDENLVHEIVRGCNGSPLALKVIGGSLCHHPYEFWQTMKERLKSNKDLDSHLQNCLDIVEDDKEKECFMDLGLFPEDQRIRVPLLNDMWTELHELDEDGVKAMNIIHSLNSKNLANVIVTRKVATDVEMYYNNHFLMQHDLLRELANHQSNQESIERRKRLAIDLTQNGKNCPNWLVGQNQPGIVSHMLSFLSVRGTQQQQKQEQVTARIMFVSTDETFTPDWYNMNPDETEVLILNIHSNKYTFPDFIQKMRKLKVLIVTHQGFHPCELNNFEVLGSLPCLKRISLEKVSVPSLCKLRKLRNLSLYMCTTKQAFGSSGIKISDALPNLVELNIDYCMDMVELPSDFCNIMTMKKLSITNCHKLSKLPPEIVMLKNLEVLRLSSCSDLKEMPESVGRLQQIWCLDISECISLTQLPADIGELHSLRKLYMWGCSGLNELPHSVTSFENLKHVIHVICDDEVAALWEHFKEFTSLPNLMIVKVRADINLRWLPGFH